MTGSDRAPSAKGALQETPFCHLLLYTYRRGNSGTLVLKVEPAIQIAIRIQQGRPTRARSPRLGPDLLQTLLPLCGLRRGTFEFFDSDLLAGFSDTISGDVDPYALLTASLHEHTRDDVVAEILQRYQGSRLRLPPKREIERLKMEVGDQALIELIRAAPFTPDELLSQSPLPPERSRRLLYALIVTHMVVPHDESTQQTIQTTTSAVQSNPSRASRRSSPAWQVLASLRPDASLRSSDRPIKSRPPTLESIVPPRTGSAPSPPAPASLRPRTSSSSPAVAASSLVPDDDIPGRIRRVDQLMLRGRMPEALEEAEAILQREPKLPEVHSLRAHVLFEIHSKAGEGLPRTMIDSLKRALEIDPDETRALFVRGLVCKRAGDLKKAAAYFKRVLQVDPKHLEAERELRLCKLRGGA